jgi:hypothetical protein
MENTKADSKEALAQQKRQEELYRERSISVLKWIEPIPIKDLIRRSMLNRRQFTPIDHSFLSLPAELHRNKKSFNFQCQSEVFDTQRERIMQDIFSMPLIRFNQVKERQVDEETTMHKTFIYKKGMDYIRSSSLTNLYSLLIKIFLNYDLSWKDFTLESYELAALLEILLRKNKKISSKM